MIKIEIQQLDSSGNPWRIFTTQCKPEQVKARLDSIYMAYNMDRTRILVDDAEIAAPGSTITTIAQRVKESEPPCIKT
jgi:hypothetical protein